MRTSGGTRGKRRADRTGAAAAGKVYRAPAGVPAAEDRHDRIRSLREEQIFEAAATLFGGRDLSLVTMDEIASRAGVAKGTLYNYFSSKEALYSSILTARMSDLLKSLRQVFREDEETKLRLKRFVAESLTFLLRHPGFFRMLRKEETRPTDHRTGGVRELRELLRDLLGRGMEQGKIRTVSTAWATDLILGTVEGAALRCIEDGCKAGRRAEESEALFDFLWRSISSADGSEGPAADLAGVAVLITREESEGGELSSAVERLGGTPIHLPLVRTAPPGDPGPVRRAAAEPSRYDWIVFTSARGVEAYFTEWCAAGSPPVRPGTAFGAVGEATARLVRERFDRVDLIARESSGEGLAAQLRAGGVSGLRFLLPRAETGRTELPTLLRAAGAFVDDVAAYRTLPVGTALRASLTRLVKHGRAVVTFASPSAVLAFAESAGFDLVSQAGGEIKFVTIGPTTSAALRSCGREPDGEAQEASFSGLAVAAARTVAAGGGANLERDLNEKQGGSRRARRRGSEDPVGPKSGREGPEGLRAERRGGSI